jgi:hypothetical protein
MTSKQSTFDLKTLNRVAQALAATTDLNEIKSLRDKAEAARQYIENARLGQSLQNFAAELKLRAERRIGGLLRELVPHGGNRRPSRHRAGLKLADFGIDSSQSSRWRREAAVPDAAFEQYVATANELGQDITAQGLLRLAKTIKNRKKRRSRTEVARAELANAAGRSRDRDDSDLLRRNGSASQPLIRDGETTDEPIHGLLLEIANHRNLLANILGPICEGRCDLALPLPRRRVIARLLAEIRCLIGRLEQAWADSTRGSSDSMPRTR